VSHPQRKPQWNASAPPDQNPLPLHSMLRRSAQIGRLHADAAHHQWNRFQGWSGRIAATAEKAKPASPTKPRKHCQASRLVGSRLAPPVGG
jgi:hypothetical protein